MMTVNRSLKPFIIDDLKQQVITKYQESPKRLQHIYNVVDTAIKLANHYGIDSRRAEVCAWAHDLNRDDDPQLLAQQLDFKILKSYINVPFAYHGFVAANILKKDYHIDDLEILKAVAYHTFGKPQMSNLAKIILLADKTCADREYEGVETLRKLSFEDLDLALWQCIYSLIEYHEKNNHFIHEDLLNLYQDLKEKYYGKN